VLRQFQSERLDNSTIFPIRSARSKQEAQDLARLTFGPGHWTVTNDLPYAYYNSQKRFWMYWQEYEEIKEENGVRYDGKRVRMRPFAMIGKSGDGKSIWRLIAESATLDLNQPIGISNKPNSEGIKVEHALVEGDVRIRDDHGTPLVLADDMNIGPMTYVDYDEAKRLITTESHVHIQDPDQTTYGDGLEILLRKPDPNVAVAQNSSSSGFGGAEYAILQKNVHVMMRDVGSSGVLPGGAPQPARKTAGASTTVDLTVDAPARDSRAKDDKTATVDEPLPLYVQSDGLMRVDFPPDTVPVAVGPPAPPAPTLVRFERKVVAVHGHPDRDPNQLDCDTLRLTLIPATALPPPGKGKAGSGGKKADKDGPSAPPASPALAAQSRTTTIAAADTGRSRGAGAPGDPAGPEAGKVAGATDGPTPSQAADGRSNNGLFGNLTLQKAHATGHVVWLQLRQQSAKVRCSEMIHERGMPYRPDSTFFRGDKTRPVVLEKVDFEPDEASEAGAVAAADRPTSSDRAPNPSRKVKSVTHVMTVSAKLFDRGNGLELVDVRAFGPGRLESRPDIGQPVERIAVWQDELTIVNLVGPDGKLQQKRVTLTGNRPFFVDLPKKTSLDSGQEIRVFLKPRSEPEAGASSVAAAQIGTDRSQTTRVAARPPGNATAGDAGAGGAGSPATDGAGGADADATTGLGGSLQIERLLAYRDVHLKAPNRYLEARQWLDAPFIEFDPVPTAESTNKSEAERSTAAGGGAEGPPSPDSSESTPKSEAPKTAASDAVASKDAAPEAPAEPAMTAVADRIWANVAIPRGQSLDPSKDRRRTKTKPKAPGAGPEMAATDSQDAESPPAAEPKEAEAEIREAWLRGNVAVHQDKPPDPEKKDQAKPKGDDICGEEVYLLNKGKGKINAQVFHRERSNPTPLPGPIRWARVSTDDMITFGETLLMDQEHDKIWANGPGTLLQWTDRALMTDKAPEPQPTAEGSGASATTMAARPPDSDANAAAPPKPKTRAGQPIADKDLLTITWTKRMEFTGRTKDTTGQPAARADFFGIVDANMTDAKLHCEQKMIVYTDREVPLGELGSSMGGSAKSGAAGREEPELPEGDENAGREAPGRSRVDIALIYCYGKPTAISRKVDPDLPVVIEQERIDAWLEGARSPKERLAYNRRTGEFYVPVPGMVFLFDRPDESQQKGGKGAASGVGAPANDPARVGQRQASGRAVTPTSARSTNRGSRPPQGDGPATPPVKRKIPPPLVLMQVKFNEMIGRMGAGQANDTSQERWSEFFGNIELVRSQVVEDAIRVQGKKQAILNPDRRLSEDGFYLTSQMLRIIQEPPPHGSPAKTPARNWAKAWERVHVNKGEAFSIESDVATFDSGSDQLYAYGEGGHGVSLAHQSGPGQPISTSHARAVQYNVKSHTWQEVEGSNLIFVDGRTGGRPGRAPAPDPTAPPPPKFKTPFKVPNTNIERRGFTGF
jgi:hypothetical protein